MNLCAIDFEYNRPAEKDMGLICVADLFSDSKYPTLGWLRDPTQRGLHQLRLASSTNITTFIGYEIQLAEARCFAALGLDPTKFRWRDLLAEWRWLRNECNEYKYGKIVKDDVAYFTTPPAVRKRKRMTDEELADCDERNAAHLEALRAEYDDSISFEEAGFSLLDCLYFFEIITLEQYKEMAIEKKRVRDYILMQGADEEIEKHKDMIQQYNASDIQYLFPLAEKLEACIKQEQEKRHMLLQDGEIVEAEPVQDICLRLGAWNARLAKIANHGIPLDKERLKIFLDVAPKITEEIKQAWNRDHADYPLYRVGFPETVLSHKRQMIKQSPYLSCEYTKDSLMLQGVIRKYCLESGIENWPKTRGGAYSTDKKALSTFAAGENLIKQLERHSGQISNLKAFTEKDGKIEALEYIGSDGRQRPDFGPHGTQTDRNAHKAKSFIFANAHWMRILINPEPDMAIVEVDYGAEEVFIAAALSGDENMMRAYLTKDYYVAYAQLVGMYPADLPIPSEAQRSEEWFGPYKKIRQIAKGICLSMQYGAGPKSIANAISLVTREQVSVDQAKEWVAEYRDTHSTYCRLIDKLRSAYQQKCGIVLANGWRLGPDNPSVLSASNLPVQGTGSVILQLAVEGLQNKGITIIATMHDSINAYCQANKATDAAAQMKITMSAAAEEVLDRCGMKIGEPEIIYHGDYWVHGDKAERDWPKYSKYFIEPK